MKQKEADAALFKKLAEVQNNVTKANRLRGPDFFRRVHTVTQTIDIQKKYQLWLYCKTALQSPSSTTKGHDIYGNIFEGPNFATQDYLGLASNPSTKEVAIQTVKEFGIHSGGAALAFGTHPYYLDFQREICEFWGVKSSLIFPTGWMAGYGVIKGLVRPWDHIVMDRLSHNCLQEGAKASTPNIHMIDHLNVNAMIDKVKEIRAKDKEAGILVVTESLFSMDSDTPDLDFLQKECKKQQAFLLIDMAHDLGALGKKGLGALETQNITDMSNVMLMGSGSKSLASNIGFIGCVDEILMEYIRYYSPPFMFSNVVAPPQCAVALHNLRIIRSEEGERLREKVLNNAIYLRKGLQKMGYEVYGNPSPIVILITGDELVSRIVARLMLNSGVIVNGIEFPIVPKGKSRLRLQLQATHTQEHLDIFLSKFDDCYKQATEVVKSFVESIPKESPKL